MKNKKFRRIAAALTAAAMMVLTVLPVYAAEAVKGTVKNSEEVLDIGTDKVSYKVDIVNGTSGNGTTATGTVTETTSKATGAVDAASEQETQAAETESTTENSDAEKETEEGPGLTMTVTVSVEDILNYLLPEETETVQTGTVSGCSLLNVRSGAGTENAVIGQLKAGDQVRVTGIDGKWYQITIPERTGYVYNKYLNVIESVSSDPSVSRDELLQILMFILENMDKEQEHTGLTPEGNMNLVDDIGPTTGEGQQFITMTSKNGNYFYLIIDRDDKENENVHLLNLVDERDLISLMEDDEAEYYEELIADQKQQVADAKAESEKLAEELKETETAAQDTEETKAGASETKSEELEDPVVSKSTGKGKLFLVVILLAALGGCGIWLAKKLKKNKVTKRSGNTPDVDDFSEEQLDIPVDMDEEERG